MTQREAIDKGIGTMNAETLAIIMAINQAAGMGADDAINKARMTYDAAKREVQAMIEAEKKSNEPDVV